jgi:hypothetical protein
MKRAKFIEQGAPDDKHVFFSRLHRYVARAS